jgi:hypothetical protein
VTSRRMARVRAFCNRTGECGLVHAEHASAPWPNASPGLGARVLTSPFTSEGVPHGPVTISGVASANLCSSVEPPGRASSSRAEGLASAMPHHAQPRHNGAVAGRQFDEWMSMRVHGVAWNWDESG